MKTNLLFSVFFFFVMLQNAQSQWTYSYLSEPKYNMGAATIGNKAYFAGGYDFKNFMDKVEVYDVSTGTWDVAGKLSKARQVIGGSASCGSKIFFAGGYDEKISYDNVDIYDALTKEWSVAHLSVSRFSLSAISHGDTVMFAGGVQFIQGSSDPVFKNTVDIYNSKTGVWTVDHLSLARMGIAASVVGDLAIFAGGMDATFKTLNRIDIYNFSTKTWSIASLSQARAYANAVTVGSKVIIAGGVTGLNIPTNRVDIYDASTGKWTTATLSVARAGIENAAVVAGKAYFAGGGTFTGNSFAAPSDIIDIYDPENNTWTMDFLRQPVASHSVVGVGNHLIVAGGKTVGELCLKKVEIYHVASNDVWIKQGAGFTEPRTILNFFPVNEKIVWASAFDCQDLTVTTDGGNTWTKKTIPDVPNLSNSMICAIDANTAWMAMFNPGGPINGGIYKTTDGGNTWTCQKTAIFDGATSFPDIIYFWNADKGVCVGDPVNGEYEIYTTTNGGTNWIKVPGSQIPDPLPGEFAIYSRYAVSGNTIWFSTNLSVRVFKSNDFGNNWSVTETPDDLTGPFWGCPLAFKDLSNGLIMSGDFTNPLKLDFTKDGGTTFDTLNYSGSIFNWSLAYVPGTGGTYASVGNSHTGNFGLTFTNDNGHSWITEPNIHGTGLSASAWINDSVGWAGGRNTDLSDGIYKFNNVLALVSNFSVSDTSIERNSAVQFQNLSKGRFTEYNWTFSGGEPASSNQKIPPPILYNSMGDYDVSLRVTGQLGTTTMVRQKYIHVGTSGIDKTTNSPSLINVYPNPASETITIEFSGSEQNIDGTIMIYGMAGQQKLSQKMNGLKSEIAVNNLPSGIYLIKLVSNNKTGVGRFVKN